MLQTSSLSKVLILRVIKVNNNSDVTTDASRLIKKLAKPLMFNHFLGFKMEL